MIGYKWDGDAYGVDLVKDVVKAYPRLYGAWTDGGTYGTTINGFGWDPAMDGNFTVTLANGTIETPDGQGVFSASAASYDGAHATNDGDWWEGGWYDGYWSYWTMEQGDTSMGYSPVGASSRKLTNGCVDGWMFAANMQTSDWKTWVAAVSADQTVNFAFAHRKIDVVEHDFFSVRFAKMRGFKYVHFAPHLFDVYIISQWLKEYNFCIIAQ